MLFLSLGSWPYGFYQILRWVVCAAAVLVGIRAYSLKVGWPLWVFGVVAILFNPLQPIHLSRNTWRPIDAVVGILFLVAALTLEGPRGDGSSDG